MLSSIENFLRGVLSSIKEKKDVGGDLCRYLLFGEDAKSSTKPPQGKWPKKTWQKGANTGNWRKEDPGEGNVPCRSEKNGGRGRYEKGLLNRATEESPNIGRRDLEGREGGKKVKAKRGWGVRQERLQKEKI